MRKHWNRILACWLVLLGGSACAPIRTAPKTAEIIALPSLLPPPKARARRNWTFADYFPRTLAEDVEQLAQNLAPASIPSDLPVHGAITSGFGMRISPIKKTLQFHEGLDIAAPLGTPILATADGFVTFTGVRGGYGQAVLLDHGRGLCTLYAHASKIFAKEGDWVTRGQKIAAVGRSGDTTGPHLHYEVQIAGKPADPEQPWFRELAALK